MTTLTDTPDAVVTPRRAAVRPPTASARFAQLVYVEMRKLVDTPASLWVILTFAILGIGITAVGVHVGKGPVQIANVLAAPQLLMTVAIPIITVLGVTADWQHRVTTSYFPTVQTRRQIAVAKLVASLLTGVVLYLALAVASLPLALIYGVMLGRGTQLGDLGQGSVVVILGLVMGVLFGFGIGSLVRKFALGMVLVIVATVGSTALSMTLPQVIQPYVSSLTPSAYLILEVGLADAGAPDRLAWYEALGSFLIWYVAPILGGMWLADRAEA